MSDELPQFPPEQPSISDTSPKEKRITRMKWVLGKLFLWLSICGLVVWLIFAGFQRLREIANSDKSLNNLKQIGLGLQNYKSAWDRFPPAAYGGLTPTTNTDSALGWRIEILNYMEMVIGDNKKSFDEQDFVHYSEPWNSPHNLALLSWNTFSFQSPLAHDKLCPYRVFNGPGTMFDPELNEGKRTRKSDVGEDPSSTILVVEAEEGVEWTRCKELSFGPGTPLPQLRETHSGALAVMVDGSVRSIPRLTSEDVLRGLNTRNGGENVHLE